MNKKSGWSYLGEGIAVFLMCIGIGSCSVLVNKNPNIPIIQINSTITTTNAVVK